MPKLSQRRASTVSNGSDYSDSGTKDPSPGETELWNQFVLRQKELLDSIKKGKLDRIPTEVELPQPTTLSKVASDVSDSEHNYDPLSIDDNSFEITSTFMELPKPMKLSPAVSYVSNDEYDPLSIHDSSFELNPTFQDYCLQLYKHENQDNAGSHDEEKVPKGRQPSDQDKSSAKTSEDCQQTFSVDSSMDNTDDDIATIISEPLMEWDLEHAYIFEV